MNKMILSAAILAAMSSTAMAQDTVRIATEGAYAPWNFVNDAGELAGYEVDLAAAICEHAGLSCEVVQNDWDSIIPNLQAGNYDVIMAGMSITEERREAIDFTQNYYPPDPSNYAAPAGSEYDFENLSGQRIGAQGNTIQAAFAEENFSDDNTIVTFATFDQAVADLAAGNIDILFADGSSLDPVVNNSGGALQFVGPDVLLDEGIGAGLRKDDDELQATLNDALDALKADGTVDELIAQWFDGAGPFFTE